MVENNYNKINKYPTTINIKEYNYESMLKTINTNCNIKFPDIFKIYKKTYINLVNSNVDYKSEIGKLIYKRLDEKVNYAMNVLRQIYNEFLTIDRIPYNLIELYLICYTYIDDYSLEEDLKNILFDRYSGCTNYGYEPNYYIQMHINDVFELEKMNLLDKFYEIELEIMHMICHNEQNNLNVMCEKLTKKSLK